jgi:hypothetical protein
MQTNAEFTPRPKYTAKRSHPSVKNVKKENYHRTDISKDGVVGRKGITVVWRVGDQRLITQWYKINTNEFKVHFVISLDKTISIYFGMILAESTGAEFTVASPSGMTEFPKGVKEKKDKDSQNYSLIQFKKKNLNQS